jgi:hypothetical protein
LFCIGFTPKEALVLHISLSPQALGTVTYYLPVLVTTDEDEFVNSAAIRDDMSEGLVSLGTTPSDISSVVPHQKRRTLQPLRQSNQSQKRKPKRYLVDDEAEEATGGSEDDYDGEEEEEEEDNDITRLENDDEEHTPIYYSNDETQLE